MPAPSRSLPVAPGGPDRRPRVHGPKGVTTADRLMPGRVRVTLDIDGIAYGLVPLEANPEVGRVVRLLPKVAGAGQPVSCVEYADTDDGLQLDGFLGLRCDCPDGADGPCRHLRALVAVGVLRPHPSWDDDGFGALAIAPLTLTAGG